MSGPLLLYTCIHTRKGGVGRDARFSGEQSNQRTPSSCVAKEGWPVDARRGFGVVVPCFQSEHRRREEQSRCVRRARYEGAEGQGLAS